MLGRTLVLVPVLMGALAVPAAAQGSRSSRRTPAPAPAPAPDRARPGDAGKPGEPGARGPLEIALLGGAWLWFSEFEARTVDKEYTIEGLATSDFRLYATVNLKPTWGFTLGPELSMGSGNSVIVGSLTLFVRIGLSPSVWLVPRAGVCAGQYNEDIVPGSFDLGIGGQGGLGLEAKLGKKTAFLLAVDARYLSFKFDPDPVVVDSDSAHGGLGVIVGAGLSFGF